MPSSSADPNLIPVDNPVLGMVDAAAVRYGVDRNLAHVVAQMESNYNPRAVSKTGAQGVMQLMPATARDLGVADSLDPAQNIDGGVKYLAQLSERYGGDTDHILAAYNAGPGAVEKFGGVPPFRETQNYVAKGTRMLASASPSDLSTDPNLTPVPVAQAAPQARPEPSVEVLPPLSEPPSEPKPPEKTFKGFLENVTTGVGRVLEPLTDPAGTLENVTNLIQGMSEKSGFAPIMGRPKQQMVDAIVNLYKHRYGSLEGFKNAWYDDPVGMAGDVAMVFSGAGLGVKAAQEFIEASGVAEHAAKIAEILRKVPAGAAADTGIAAQTRIQAGVNGAVDALGKRYMQVIEGGMKQAPSGVLGGPHGMLAAAKYGAAKKAVEILKDGWKAGTTAYDAPAGAAAAAEEAAAAATPKAAAAPAVAKTPGQVYAESEGHDWAKLSADHKQLMEQIAQAHENVAAQSVPSEPPVTPPAAPQAAPAAPEAPAATPEPVGAPVEPGAPQTLQPAASVEKLTEYVIGKKIAPHMVDKLPAEYWQMIADDAGVQVPTADEIAQIKQNVAEKSIAAQGEKTFQEQKAAVESEMTPPKETPPSAAPPAAVMLKPGQTPAQALAEMLPESAGPPPAAGPAAATASETRVEALAQHFAKDAEITPDAIRSIANNPDAAGLLTKLSDSLGIKGRPAPGEIEKIANRVGELRQAQAPAAIPTEGIETPAQAKAAFETEQAKPAPAPVKQAKPVKSPETMSAAEINKRLDQLDKKSSQLNARMIEEGRGNERPSDYAKKTDPLSSEINALYEERRRLQIEMELRYGPGTPSRLPRGFGPRKRL